METFICADFFRSKFNSLCVKSDVPAAPYRVFFVDLSNQHKVVGGGLQIHIHFQ